ncbi:hypothetical protein K461DRAFT_267503 [Myriangium duriaei CBS 260.36]|uniref:Uncharacterized protein n=1 Tax=Myriangium duriaei CBS 260.36 TaxID=1168546 RepID=A0A9P4MH94_9PEZI|nr:hypothetical protein K461DRAFT_267503 [Myriangium duriaei CBS 260.36]
MEPAKSETIRSILCSEGQWLHDTDGGSYITFNEDRTGMLCLRVNVTPWFTCDFDWKDHQNSDLDRPVQLTKTWFKRNQLLARFNIEIAFRTAGENFDLGDGYLWRRIPGPYQDETPRPRTMTAKLEKGAFLTPLPNAVAPWYNELRLTFETSPYSSHQEWGMNHFPFWERKDFVARRCAAPVTSKIPVLCLSRFKTTMNSITDIDNTNSY